MSIPLDFVGLNTLLTKRSGKELNETFSSLKPKYHIIPAPAGQASTSDNPGHFEVDGWGLGFNIREILGDRYDANHRIKDVNALSRGVVKNLSISMWIDLSNYSPANNTNITALNAQLTDDTEYYFVFSPISRNPGAEEYGLINKTLAFVRHNNKLHLVVIRSAHTLSGTGAMIKAYDANNAFDLGETTPINITITCNDPENNNSWKEPDADRPQSIGNNYVVYINGKEVIWTKYISSSNGGMEQEGSDSPGGTLFTGYGYSNQFEHDPDLLDLLSFANDFTIGQLMYALASGSPDFDSNHASLTSTSKIYNVALYTKYLTEKQVFQLYKLGKDYYHIKQFKNITLDDEGLDNPLYILNEEFEETDISLKDRETGNLNLSVASFTGSYGEQSILSAYLNNTNGPYGFSMIKQTRSSKNWLSRYYNKENIYSITTNKGEERQTISSGVVLSSHKDKYGSTNNFYENCVTNKHKPIEVIGTISDDGFDEEKIIIKGSHSNEKQYFKNDFLNIQTSKQFTDSITYEDIKKILNKDSTPLDSFDSVKIKQCVFPKNKFSFSKNHRSRPNLNLKIWNDNRDDRELLNSSNGMSIIIPSQSFWPLDASKNFSNTLTTTPASTSVVGFHGGSLAYNSSGASGVLQNTYSLFHTSSTFEFDMAFVDNIVTASVIYSRPHTLVGSSSAINRVFPNYTSSLPTTSTRKYTGQAPWLAGEQAGYYNYQGDFISHPKTPFPNSYEEWSEPIKRVGKDYSIVPEFKISKHIEHYVANGFTSEKLDIFEVEGGNRNYAISSDSDFYTIYSTTDFLDNFEIVKNDLGDKVKPSSITLRCKAIKKFLPYEGFYPCQRVVDLGKQFYKSYSKYIFGTDVDGPALGGEWRNDGYLKPDGIGGVFGSTANRGRSKYYIQNIMRPLFSPGVLNNSIKSGIACDYPIYTQNFNTSSNTTEKLSHLDFLIAPTFGSASNGGVFSFQLKPGPADVNTYHITASATNAITSLGSRNYRVEYSSSFRTVGSEDIDVDAENLRAILDNLGTATIADIGGGHPGLQRMIRVIGDSGDYFLNFAENPGANADLIMNPLPATNFITTNGVDGTNGIYKTGYSDLDSLSASYYMPSTFDKRIPFEALIEPEKYLANYSIYTNEPDAFHPKTKSDWSGQGDGLYKMMANNFVSEVGDFFLLNDNFSTITSLPQGDPNFGNVQEGKVYGMRLKMYRSITGSKTPAESHDGISYSVPQDLFGNTDGMKESFTMYSRPSAFGPPVQVTANASSPVTLKNWASFKQTGSLDFSYILDDTIATNATASITDEGENWEYTPPYYHGEAWADIFFKPPSGAKKYSLAEIINNSSVEFYRHYVSSSDGSQNIEDRSVLINEQAMQIASSMNMFSRGILAEDSDGLTINTELETKYRWIIQSKFEAPTLNFNHHTFNTAVGSQYPSFQSAYKSATVPIGMWHQYGRIPQDSGEGIFVQVAEIPRNWIEGAMRGNINNTGSLVELCGFSTDPVRVGEIKNTKLVEEAVVAVPFVNREGFRKFFKLNKSDVESAIKGVEEAVGPTVFKLTQQLDKYVFPPQFDYKRNPDTTAVAMYVFEFSHEFTKQDLADMWQGLPPKLGEVYETVESTISHALFAEELLGSGADPKTTQNGIERNIVSELTELPSDIQWMVFKVKKRAKSNYFEKMFQRNESRDSDSNTNFTVDSTGKKSDISFNWPYDFFSMVELIKLDAEVEFSNVDEERSKQENKLVTRPYIFRED